MFKTGSYKAVVASSEVYFRKQVHKAKAPVATPPVDQYDKMMNAGIAALDKVPVGSSHGPKADSDNDSDDDDDAADEDTDESSEESIHIGMKARLRLTSIIG